MVGKRFQVTVLAASLSFAACGGGGGGSANGGLYGGSPPVSSQSNIPVQQTVLGQPAFVNAANQHTLYFLDVDTPTGSGCTGTCLSVWLPNVPSSGASAQAGFTIITRSDGTGMQWAYKTHPLYTYAGDSGPDEANGNGIPFAGGHWHIERPAN